MNCLVCGKTTFDRAVGQATFAQCTCGFARLRASGKLDGYWEGRDDDAVNHVWADTQDALFNAVLKEIASRVPDGTTIYDVGGGIGYFSELAIRAGFDSHNVELSEVACAKARDRIGADRVHTSLAGMAPADVVKQVFKTTSPEPMQAFILNQRRPLFQDRLVRPD